MKAVTRRFKVGDIIQYKKESWQEQTANKPSFYLYLILKISEEFQFIKIMALSSPTKRNIGLVYNWYGDKPQDVFRLYKRTLNDSLEGKRE